jgi:hypothetical protein
MLATLRDSMISTGGGGGVYNIKNVLRWIRKSLGFMRDEKR